MAGRGRERHNRLLAQAAARTDKPPSADSIAAENTRLEEARYQEIYRPVNQELIAELGENRLLDAAQEEANRISPEKTLARAKRQVARHGGQLSTHQVDRLTDAVELGNAKDYSFTLSNARLKQREFHDNLRAEVINIGRGISNSGNSMLQDAANKEAQRNAANANVEAANDAAKKQMIGAGLGLAAMVFL